MVGLVGHARHWKDYFKELLPVECIYKPWSHQRLLSTTSIADVHITTNKLTADCQNLKATRMLKKGLKIVDREEEIMIS